MSLASIGKSSTHSRVAWRRVNVEFILEQILFLRGMDLDSLRRHSRCSTLRIGVFVNAFDYLEVLHDCMERLQLIASQTQFI